MARFFCGLKANPTVVKNLSDSFFLKCFFKLVTIKTSAAAFSSFLVKCYCLLRLLAFFYNNFICNNQMINLIKAPIIYK